MLTGRPVWHRKQWEWVFIIHHLIESGLIAEGRRGVGFGVGQEALPALFASLGATVTATDAPIGLSEGWNVTAQHSQSLEALRAPWIVPNELFDRRISFQPCDMSNIDPSLRDFDFTWSSCCFEHLGSLKAGMDFVVNSVERCLKPGGVAVHTTEFNLSSNEQTEESGVTVLYRRRDIEELIALLRDRGHEVKSLSIGPTAHHLDTHVDVPPYSSSLHLKLKLGSYVCTSVGLIIKRGDL
jgi:SAM-dependent methyltransferase